MLSYKEEKCALNIIKKKIVQIDNFMKNLSPISFIAPFIETLIFQSLVIELLEKIKILNEKKYIIVIISAILFGISHSYSYIYIFYAGILGLFLGYAYIVYQKKHFSPFLMVIIIHSLRNTIAAVGNVLLF